MDQVNRPKRKYVSKRRKQQARETRQRILAAALEKFSTYGYAGAAVETIAQEAGVAPVTIFAAFGNKRSILAELVHISVGGDEQTLPLLTRAGPQAVLSESDPILKIQLFAADITEILDRVSPLFEIMRMAARTEPEIEEMLRNTQEERFLNLKMFVQSLSMKSCLRKGLDETRAAEIVWTIASPEVFRLLTIDRGWTKELFSQWLGDTLARLLLP